MALYIKKILRISAVLFLVIMLCFVLLEISLRMYQACDPAYLIPPDMTYLKYRGRPNSMEFNGFKLNSRGFKDSEFDRKKSPGQFRILCLGDSQVYGAVPYPDAYITLVGKKLRSACPQCELLNMGVPSAGPVDYLSILLNEGLDLHPDMVLLHFDMYDDFKNGGKRHMLSSHSAAASLICMVYASLFEPKGRIFATGTYREGIPLRSYKSYVRVINDAHGDIFQKNNASFHDDFQSSFSFVIKIKKVCDARKIPVAVVVFPADMQLYSDLQNKIMMIRHRTRADYDYRLPNTLLSAAFKQSGIEYLDLLNIFLDRYARNGKSFTQVHDMHWNRYGSRAAADAVSPWLIRQVGWHTNLRQDQK